ncbi:hypothetical protein SAHY_04463 [Salinisphaera hydrothermalis EPR70]
MGAFLALSTSAFAASGDQADTAKSKEGSHKLEAKIGRTTFKVKGYIKLDAIYNFTQNLGANDNSDALVVHGHTNRNFSMYAKESRIALVTTTPTPLGDIHGFVSGDFYGSGGSQKVTNNYDFRLRQAYFKWNHWLFGQAWSNFSDIHYWGQRLAFSGPVGKLFIRQPQVRYTFDLNDRNKLSLSVENPYASIQTDAGGNVKPQIAAADDIKDQGPDLTARYRWTRGPASIQFGALGRALKYDGNNGSSGTEFGWGLNLDASYTFSTGTTLLGGISGGKGIGRYLYHPYVGEGYVDGNNDLHLIAKWGGHIGISQKLSPKWTTNLIYGRVRIEDLPGEFSTVDREQQDVHANVMYRPVKSLMFGMEYIYTYRQLQNRNASPASTMQASAVYYF